METVWNDIGSTEVYFPTGTRKILEIYFWLEWLSPPLALSDGPHHHCDLDLADADLRTDASIQCWLAFIFVRNAVITFVYAGWLHLHFYIKEAQGTNLSIMPNF